ncbi:uncharacterized protein Z520_07357 [Fonsecaea multimorphosa CBS 102226]|uniref:Uncharacterized protein n=1 Tax=Fonsecaea multimorphosa CBS 102226 TaxID=1442371 RepID=A0A0D2JUT9_9EURO|nr:uncharacterized protein Z520_07357 [Fonsecaea multimorphosa CBS 102226]KIX97242.1 hypothetical protein Z520_07357 [Fonsecaea multimorphosa CBS 102226]OAL23014.1 hypothetical protein AYO22_06922 [Fonsecaea multimorphosa]
MVALSALAHLINATSISIANAPQPSSTSSQPTDNPAATLLSRNIIPSGCYETVGVGWGDFRVNRTINKCYPYLEPTCERIAKATLSKWMDFCAQWDSTGNNVVKTCQWKKNKPYSLYKDAPKDDDRRNMPYRVPGPLRCCPPPYEGVDVSEYDMSNSLCRMWRVENDGEYRYYSQNFPLYGIFDEEYNYENMNIWSYDPETHTSDNISLLDEKAKEDLKTDYSPLTLKELIEEEKEEEEKKKKPQHLSPFY